MLISNCLLTKNPPSTFQKVMDTILQGIPNVMCYIDNILVIAADDQTHLRNLTKVLQHFKCLHCVFRLYIRSFAAGAYTYIYTFVLILTERVL